MLSAYVFFDPLACQKRQVIAHDDSFYNLFMVFNTTHMGNHRVQLATADEI